MTPRSRRRGRYFLISYSFSDGVQSGNGNCSMESRDGSMPSIKFITEYARNNHNQNIIISSIYEFPTRRDFKQFYSRDGFSVTKNMEGK